MGCLMKEYWQKKLTDEQLLNRIKAYYEFLTVGYSTFMANMLSICIVEAGFRKIHKKVVAILDYNPYAITDYEGNII